MIHYLKRFHFIVAKSCAVLAVLFVACGAASTATPPLPTEAPTATTASPETPTQAPPASPTPTRQATISPRAIVEDDRVFIQLTDPLDEPEFYCVDVPGAGAGVRLESALQVHTCKTITTAADELFTMNQPKEGQIYMEAYDLCVEAEEAENGSFLRLQSCSDSPHQLFALESDLIRLSGGGQGALCLAVAPGSGTPTGGPSHLRRDLTLEECEAVESTLIKWSVGLFDY